MHVGLHTPLQDTSVADLRTLWTTAETLGFNWISVWDHLGSLRGTVDNFEGVAMHAALACSTERVRCACLVYSIGYRSPLVLAEAAATIDHLSNGRAVLGLGAGYLASEYQALGVPLPSPGDRSRHLGEAARAIRSLLDGDEVTVDGRHVHLDRARCAPAPVQTRLPLFIGGGGERSTIPLAAAIADGWNVPMATADDAARKIALLRQCEEAAGRPTGSVEASIGIGICFDEAQIPTRYGDRWQVLRPSIAGGSTQQVIDTVARYAAAGTDLLVLSVRSPLDSALIDDLERFTAEVMPAFR